MSFDAAYEGCPAAHAVMGHVAKVGANHLLYKFVDRAVLKGLTPLLQKNLADLMHVYCLTLQRQDLPKHEICRVMLASWLPASPSTDYFHLVPSTRKIQALRRDRAAGREHHFWLMWFHVHAGFVIEPVLEELPKWKLVCKIMQELQSEGKLHGAQNGEQSAVESFVEPLRLKFCVAAHCSDCVNCPAGCNETLTYTDTMSVVGVSRGASHMDQSLPGIKARLVHLQGCSYSR